MDSDSVLEASSSVDDVDTTRSELGSSKVDDTSLILLSDEELNGDLGNAEEALRRIELDLAFASEKLCNLNILMMRVAIKEGELEAFDSAKEKENSSELIEKALQFDFLSSFLNSEVKELESLLNSLKGDILATCRLIASSDNHERYTIEMEEKLKDCEETLQQLLEQVAEIRGQSDTLQKTVTELRGEETGKTDNGIDTFMNGKSLNTRNKMQTVEQQRHFLRMLEKSLARELDLEKKVSESRLIEEELKIKLQSARQEVNYLEEEVVKYVERFFEADSSAEVLSGISKELLGRLQILQFNLIGSAQREAELRLKIDNIFEQLKLEENDHQKRESSLKASLKEANHKLVMADSVVTALKESEILLKRQIEEQESSTNGSQEQLILIEDLKEKLSKSEALCKFLSEKNLELGEELRVLNGSGITPEMVNALEKRMRESDVLLQRAVASAEASEENQKMLSVAIKDMENTIEDLKNKVSKAEIRADGAENKCIILSEANAELNEELDFLRGKMELFEGLLTRAEDMKVRSAKDIRYRADLMVNLVMQLTVERERLHKQISSLVKDNGILVMKLYQMSKDPEKVGGKLSSADNSSFPSTTSTGEPNEQIVTEHSAALDKMEENIKNTSTMSQVPGGSISQQEGSRRIDVGVLSLKGMLVAALILLIAAVATKLFSR
ncbi:hypothetical protein SAY86_012775 [Trapa natans]|uniref:WIT1/2 N-terminal helical bundle domain-containing protein n=1 Tax=Trapa natans TaxID=22666 RepID=A0AAN7MDV5_TRANT|nr:hypothetical protein SAY86_012775 [Trapa natans]